MKPLPAEEALLKVLASNPGDWSIRLLIAEKFYLRGADDRILSLLKDAPEPPGNTQELEKVIRFAGNSSLDIVSAYVAEHPADGFAHYSLGSILEDLDETERAEKHYEVAIALGFSAGGENFHEEPDRAEHTTKEEATSESTAEQILRNEDQSTGTKPDRQTGSKAVAVLVTIAVHALIGLIAALLIVLPSSNEEPEIVASIITPPAPKSEMKKKEVVKQVKRSAASSAAAAPLARLMRSNASAVISLPQVTKTSIGPLGIGEGDFGVGAFGGAGADFGTGATLFGGAGGNGLTGKFYDFKRDKNGDPTGLAMNSNLFSEIIREFANGPTWKPPGRKHFTSPTTLTGNIFFFPAMQDTKAGEAFQAEGTGPGMWIAHYSGTIVPAVSGKFRLVGWGDNLLAVKIGTKVVLDASDKQSLRLGQQRSGGVSFPRKTAATPVFNGDWFNLRAGTPVTCDIMLGDAGGIFCAGVHIQKDGSDYKAGDNGIPDLPAFIIGATSPNQRKLYKDYLSSKHFSGSAFNTRR